MRKSIYLFFTSIVIFYSCSNEVQLETSLENKEVITNSNRLTKEDATNVLLSYLNNHTQLRSSSPILNILDCKTKNASDYGDVKVSTRSTIGKDEDKDIPIYEFTISEDGNKTGFALVVGDRRFDEVIAYAPYGSLADTVFNEGLRLFTSSIPKMIEEVVREESNPSEMQTRSDYYQPEQSSSYYYDSDISTLVTRVYSESEFNAIWSKLVVYTYDNGTKFVGEWDEFVNPCSLVAVQWHQEAPYNDNVEMLCSNKRGKIGCGVVAIAQIMAYHRQPASYNWSLIKSAPQILPTNANYANGSCKEVAKLMIDIATKANITYKCVDGKSSGGINSYNVVPTLQSLGYSANYAFDRREKVSVDTLYNNLVKGQPVIIECEYVYNSENIKLNAGHMWVIDGLYRKSRNRYTFSATTEWTGRRFWEIEKWRQNFAQSHNNWGWGGSSDGWYHLFTPVNEGYTFKGFGLFTQIKYKGK